jgi:hypothetical protein
MNQKIIIKSSQKLSAKLFLHSNFNWNFLDHWIWLRNMNWYLNMLDDLNWVGLWHWSIDFYGSSDWIWNWNWSVTKK